MSTRLKMVCSETRTRRHWQGTGKTGGAILNAVTSGSEENKQFFEATPNGRMEFDTINEAALAMFEPGAEYYVTIERVPA